MFSAGFEKVAMPNFVRPLLGANQAMAAGARGAGSTVSQMRAANKAMAVNPAHSVTSVAKQELSQKVPSMNLSPTAARRRQNFMDY